MEDKTTLKNRLFNELKKSFGKAGIELTPEKPAYKFAESACELAAEASEIPHEIGKAFNKAKKDPTEGMVRSTLFEKLETFYRETNESLFAMPYLGFHLGDFAKFMERRGSPVRKDPSISNIEDLLDQMSLNHKEVIVDFLIANTEARDEFLAIMKTL